MDTEQLKEYIGSRFELPGGFSEEHFAEAAADIKDRESLEAALPAIREMHESCVRGAERCKERAKEFSDSRRQWESRAEQVGLFAAFLLKRMNIKSVSCNGVKASLTTRVNIEVTDEGGLLSPYSSSGEYARLRESLPEWVKVTLSIDKKALNAAVKADGQLLLDKPEMIRSAESETVRLS